MSVIPANGDMKLVEGAQTFILTAETPTPITTKRRQSSHRREFRNVYTNPLATILTVVNLQASIFHARSIESYIRCIAFHRLLHALLARSDDLHHPHFLRVLSYHRTTLWTKNPLHPAQRFICPGTYRCSHVWRDLHQRPTAKSRVQAIHILERSRIQASTCNLPLFPPLPSNTVT